MWTWYYIHSILWYNNSYIWNLFTFLWKKVSFNLLDDEDFTIPYITDTIPNAPSGHQLLTQAKINGWIIYINGEDPITAQDTIDELNHHQNLLEESKVNVSPCIRKSYQRTDIEEICSRFDQFRPIVSHLGVRLPKKPPTPKNIGEGLKYPQR